MDDGAAGCLGVLVIILDIAVVIGSGVLAWNWIDPDSFGRGLLFVVVWGVAWQRGARPYPAHFCGARCFVRRLTDIVRIVYRDIFLLLPRYIKSQMCYSPNSAFIVFGEHRRERISRVSSLTVIKLHFFPPLSEKAIHLSSVLYLR